MVRTWQLQEAKNKFSEVVRRAATEGPQIISVHGKEEAVVISINEYRAASPGRGNRRRSAWDVLSSGPKLTDEELAAINNRSKEEMRPLDFSE